MWIHIVIFMVILGAFLAGKLGRLPPWAGNAEGQKLFILVALAGNIIGMLLTAGSGNGQAFLRAGNGNTAGYRDARAAAHPGIPYRRAAGVCNGHAYDAGRFV